MDSPGTNHAQADGKAYRRSTKSPSFVTVRGDAAGLLLLGSFCRSSTYRFAPWLLLPLTDTAIDTKTRLAA